MLKSIIKNTLPDWLILIHEYRKKNGVFPNVIAPKTFNEKVLHRIIFDRRPILAQLTDKAAVRSYVESRLGRQVLPKLYYITTRPETIPFDQLPDRFVVKPTHGCNWVQMIMDKSTLDRAALIETCKGWLNQSFYKINREWIYKNIERRIIVEEFVDDGSEGAPNDYKLYVFDGTVRLIHVDKGRFRDHLRHFFTPDWKRVDVRHVHTRVPSADMPKPPHLEEMIAAAETLGVGLDFVRADFYDTTEKLYFGELTTTPGCGRNLFNPQKFERYLGSLWRLPDTQPIPQLLKVARAR